MNQENFLLSLLLTLHVELETRNWELGTALSPWSMLGPLWPPGPHPSSRSPPGPLISLWD